MRLHFTGPVHEGIMQERICYCFDYTPYAIEADIAQNGKSTILARILEEKQSGRCRCAVQHPQGR
jgi:hypothetical protein